MISPASISKVLFLPFNGVPFAIACDPPTSCFSMMFSVRMVLGGINSSLLAGVDLAAANGASMHKFGDEEDKSQALMNALVLFRAQTTPPFAHARTRITTHTGQAMRARASARVGWLGLWTLLR